MAIARDNNPHSLTPHVAQGVTRGLCSCCELPFKTRPRESGRAYCDDCREHYAILGESPERREERLVDDRRRVGEFYMAMRQLLTQNEAELKLQRSKVASALESRDRWRAKIEAVERIHHVNERGACVCGKRPCPVRTAIEHAEPEPRGY